MHYRSYVHLWQDYLSLMKTTSTKSTLYVLVTAASMLSVANAPAAGTDIYFHDPPEVFISPGLSFFTTLRVAATDKAVGAFSFLLNYDTNALQIQQVFGVSGSAFGTNVFADISSFQSGSTRIVGFQTSTATPSPEGQPVCYIVWATVGESNRLVQITGTVEKHVGSAWQTDEIWSWPSFVTISTDPPGPPQDLRVSTMEIVGADITLSFPTTQGKSYQIECCDDLTQNIWVSVGDVVTGTGGLACVLELDGAAHPVRFYRVRIVQ